MKWIFALKPHIFGTQDWKIQRVAKTWLHMSPDAHEHFLRIPPANSITTFTDEEFDFAVRLRQYRVASFPTFICSNPKVNFSHPQHAKDFTNHILSCCACSTQQWKIRHEAIANAFHRCCKFHGYNSELISPTSRQYARNNNTCGGSDLHVYTNGKTYAIDFTVTKDAAPSEGNKNRADGVQTPEHQAVDSNQSPTL